MLHSVARQGMSNEPAATLKHSAFGCFFAGPDGRRHGAGTPAVQFQPTMIAPIPTSSPPVT
ncbi:hypothetical protein M3615_21455, partial [Bacillus halotolerans]|nr:hypothetical protein [Bacillus halotolerans]